MYALFYGGRVLALFLLFRLDAFVWGERWWLPSRWVHACLWSRQHRMIATMARGQRLRMALERLGPIWVKFGQLLSVRYDVLPEDVVAALALLQDAVTPFPGEEAVTLVQQALGQPVEAVFENFELTPLAQASIAQVHAAKLKADGAEVVVKLLRPGIHKKIKRDLRCLYGVAHLLHRLLPDAARIKPVSVVAELEYSLQQELCLRTEAANAMTLKRHFPDEHPLKVPAVYWDHCRDNMMVMDRVDGIRISDVEALKRAGVDMALLAKRGVDLFFTQVLQHSFFHADMHPGNIFVDVRDPKNPGYVLVDFGIMGALSPTDQRYIAENLLAFFKRDYRRVALLHVESGWVPANTRIDQFEAAIRSVCEPIFAKPLKDISFGLLFMQLLRIARQFHTDIQPQLILLQKTLLNVESLGRRLYPELNLWETAHPILEKWVKSQMGWSGFVEKSKTRLPIWLEQCPELPEMVHRFLAQSTRQSPPVIVQAPKPQTWPTLCLGMVLGCVLWVGGMKVLVSPKTHEAHVAATGHKIQMDHRTLEMMTF